ncbi:DUF616 domain-containing protein [Parablautia intestinalis]|uniref:DUF616 domain-containing protein n=1 Tax=Parablautia intestinalis TaxID=2320100 RepID=A0A3A9AAI9_9FIRM|nr:glycosyltransferase domain-containing protein [Parablautia intestinalis]RKI88652.1 DUF616 domain-containing protein [Parablautia intestinalis]
MRDIKVIRENIKLAQSGRFRVCIWGAGFLGTTIGYDILTKLGIIPDFYCDNKNKLWGKKIKNGIRCVDYHSLQNIREGIIFFVFAGNVFETDIVEQLKELEIYNYVTLSEVLSMTEVMLQAFPFMNEKVVAYTCIVGGYDDLLEPGEDVLKKYDYYLISDKKPSHKSTYQWIDVRDVIPDSVTDYTRMNRFCKINAHKIFPQYRRSIYYDGNILLKHDLQSYFDKLGKTRIGVASPNHWNCLYEEAIRMIPQMRDKPERIYAQMNKYWHQGMPRKFGSCWCNVLIREHNNPVCVKIMEDWWKEVEIESNRDQLSFPYVLWKNNYLMEDVLLLSEMTNKSFYWEFVEKHNVDRLIKAKPSNLGEIKG